MKLKIEWNKNAPIVLAIDAAAALKAEKLIEIMLSFFFHCLVGSVIRWNNVMRDTARDDMKIMMIK